MENENAVVPSPQVSAEAEQPKTSTEEIKSPPVEESKKNKRGSAPRKPKVKPVVATTPVSEKKSEAVELAIDKIEEVKDEVPKIDAEEVTQIDTTTKTEVESAKSSPKKVSPMLQQSRDILKKHDEAKLRFEKYRVFYPTADRIMSSITKFGRRFK